MKKLLESASILGSVLLLALTLTGCGRGTPTGPDPTGKNILRGTVVAEKGPVPGAEIIVDNSETGVYTGDDGRFEVLVEPGEHAVAAEVDGVRSSTVGIDSHEEEEIVIEVALDEVEEQREERRHEERDVPREDEGAVDEEGPTGGEEGTYEEDIEHEGDRVAEECTEDPVGEDFEEPVEEHVEEPGAEEEPIEGGGGDEGEERPE